MMSKIKPIGFQRDTPLDRRLAVCGLRGANFTAGVHRPRGANFAMGPLVGLGKSRAWGREPKERADANRTRETGDALLVKSAVCRAFWQHLSAYRVNAA